MQPVEKKESDDAPKHCTECKGNVDDLTQFIIMTGCRSFTTVHPCKECGRLHWPDGTGLQNRSGKKMYSLNGRLSFFNEDGAPIII